MAAIATANQVAPQTPKSSGDRGSANGKTVQIYLSSFASKFREDSPKSFWRLHRVGHQKYIPQQSPKSPLDKAFGVFSTCAHNLNPHLSLAGHKGIKSVATPAHPQGSLYTTAETPILSLYTATKEWAQFSQPLNLGSAGVSALDARVKCGQ